MWSPSLVSAAVLLMEAVLVVTARSESCNVTQVYHMNTLHQMQQFSNHDGTGTGDGTCARTLRELSALQGDVRNMSDRQMQILDQTARTDSNATMESLQTVYHSILSDLKKMAGAMNHQFVRLSERLDAMENVTSLAFDNRKTASDLSKLSGAMNNQFVQLSRRLDAMENVTSSAFVQFSQRLDTMENVTSSAADNQKTASDLSKLSGAMNNQFVQLSQRLDAMENTTSSDLSELSDIINKQFLQLSLQLNARENTTSLSAQRFKLLMDTLNRTDQSVDIRKNAVSQSHPTDCEDIFLIGHNSNGVYLIWPRGSPGPVRVFCEMGTEKWTVIMRRFDGSVSFEETWDRYKWGFGTTTGEFWLGLEHMHFLTKQRPMKLRFDMTEWESGSSYYAVFHSLTIASSSLNYRIHVERRSGTAEIDRFTPTDGKPFTAKDNDNDSSSGNCAVKEQGGWWHGDCAQALPTGPYRRSCGDDRCMTWRYSTALNRVTMKLARV